MMAKNSMKCIVRGCVHFADEDSDYCVKHKEATKKCFLRGCDHQAIKGKKYCKRHEDLEENEFNKRFKRKCLKCGRTFKSKSQYNRICDGCKNTKEWQYGENFDY